MLAYILRRIVLLVPVLLGLSMLVFAIGRLLPGDPVLLAAGPNASREEVAALSLALQHLALPAIAMSLSPLATITRMMRASTMEVLQQDYVLTARALGIPPGKLLFKHVLRNALSSTLTVIGLYFGWLLGGTVLVETVFDWPGIGLYATKSILTQDFMPVMGVVLSIGTMFVLFNLVIDLLYGVINPRVQLR